MRVKFEMSFIIQQVLHSSSVIFFLSLSLFFLRAYIYRELISQNEAAVLAVVSWEERFVDGSCAARYIKYSNGAGDYILYLLAFIKFSQRRRAGPGAPAPNTERPHPPS